MKNANDKPTTTITIRLENDILDQVKEISVKERRSINAQINALLEEALKKRLDQSPFKHSFKRILIIELKDIPYSSARFFISSYILASSLIVIVMLFSDAIISSPFYSLDCLTIGFMTFWQFFVNLIDKKNWYLHSKQNRFFLIH